MSDTLKKIQQGDLYALLSLCTKEELEPIVEKIISKVSNFIDINEEYKKFSPDHTKYHKIIGDEIRLFGGNSICNLFRSEGPPYSQIVIDVCKKLDIPYQNDNIIKNENNLLDIFLERCWSALNPEEREKLAKSASINALDKISDVSTLFKKGATFLITDFIFGPIGWFYLGNALFDANYKVTVPCVLHISYLRRKILDEKRGHVTSPDNRTTLPLDKKYLPAKMLQSVEVRNTDNESVFSLTQIEEPVGKSWQAVNDTEGNIGKINSLLQLIPSLASAQEVLTKHYVTIVTDGNRLLKTTSGGLKAVTVRPDGKFSKIADIIDTNRLSSIITVSAVWSIASMIVAQKHLADIDKKLSHIKHAIDNIRKFQDDERHSILTGSIRYFEQITPSILAGELPDRILQQIERHEADLLRVQDHLTKEIHDQIEHIQTIKDEDTFGLDGITQAITAQQQRLNALYQEMLLCLRARAYGWQLLCLFPEDEISKKSRKEDIQKSFDNFKRSDKIIARADKLLREKIHTMSNLLSRETSVNNKKLSLLRLCDEHYNNIMKECETIQRDLDKADSMYAATRQSAAMTVCVENGRITALQLP